MPVAGLRTGERHSIGMIESFSYGVLCRRRGVVDCFYVRVTLRERNGDARLP
jgi:hypothetical protein